LLPAPAPLTRFRLVETETVPSGIALLKYAIRRDGE
jgi:hypothetical protein